MTNDTLHVLKNLCLSTLDMFWGGSDPEEKCSEIKPPEESYECCKNGMTQMLVSLSLLCFQFYLLFLPEIPIIFTHYSYFIPMPSLIIPEIFVSVTMRFMHAPYN